MSIESLEHIVRSRVRMIVRHTWLLAILGTAIVIATHDLALMDQFGYARRLVVGGGRLTVYDAEAA